MASDHAAGRAQLWRRYDTGELSADELEARLGLLDRAGEGDAAAIEAAVNGPVPVHRRASSRRVALVAGGLLAAAALAAGAVVVAGAVGGDGQATTAVVGGPAGPAGPGGPFPTVVAEPLPPPPPCEDLGPAVDLSGESAATDALLSDPPFVPDGYEHRGDDEVEPGFDTDVAMATAAGTPLPVEIAVRELDGDLVVRMRAFRYSSAEDASAAALAVADSACSFGAVRFEIADRPEIGGSVVSGPIPTTAFAGWTLGDRRLIVAVESESDDPDDLAEAQALAGAVAGAELDAARGAAPAPAP